LRLKKLTLLKKLTQCHTDRADEAMWMPVSTQRTHKVVNNSSTTAAALRSKVLKIMLPEQQYILLRCRTLTTRTHNTHCKQDSM